MNDDVSVSRRGFFRRSAAVAAAATVPALTARADDETEKPAPPVQPLVLPTRKLGKTGVEVTILGQGGGFAINDRHMNLMHTLGIRYLDTAKAYLKGGSERNIAKWFEKEGKRKEMFLVTKDIPMSPEDVPTMIDERLENLQTDYIDLFFLHALGDADHYHGIEDAKWLADPEWTKAIEKVRKSGKCRFFGFSSHAEPIETRIGLLNTAAKGGWVDALMVASDPTLIRENADFNKALDACYRAGIGIVSMKECRGGPEGIEKIFPGFKDKGLSPFTAVLSAMWTDERFSAVCSHMDNFEKLQENAAAAAKFKPLSSEELTAVYDMLKSGRRTLCLNCDGSCRRAGRTQADLNTIARYVNYAEEDGRVYEARELLAALPPAARDCSGADLDAAAHACRSRLDFPRIIRRAEELLA